MDPSGPNSIAEAPPPCAASDSEFETRIQPPSGGAEGGLPVREDVPRVAGHRAARAGDLARAEAGRQHQPVRVGRVQRAVGPGARGGRRGQGVAPEGGPERKRGRCERSRAYELATAKDVVGRGSSVPPSAVPSSRASDAPVVVGRAHAPAIGGWRLGAQLLRENWTNGRLRCERGGERHNRRTRAGRQNWRVRLRQCWQCRSPRQRHRARIGGAARREYRRCAIRR